MAAPVDPVPDPQTPLYAGLRFVLPLPSDPAEVKAGAKVMLGYLHDLLDYADKAHDRLQRTAEACAGK